MNAQREARAIEHAPDCKPEHMVRDEDEPNVWDCMNCGLWEIRDEDV